jgi:hypothetical protein
LDVVDDRLDSAIPMTPTSSPTTTAPTQRMGRCFLFSAGAAEVAAVAAGRATTGAGSPWPAGSGCGSSGAGSLTAAESVVANVHAVPVQYRLRDGVQKSGYQPGGACGVGSGSMRTILARLREAPGAAVWSSR